MWNAREKAGDTPRRCAGANACVTSLAVSECEGSGSWEISGMSDPVSPSIKMRGVSNGKWSKSSIGREGTGGSGERSIKGTSDEGSHSR